MNFFAALRSAWRSLAANTLRSILTMLGIIIGVAAVITMIAVGRGATDRVQEQMKGLGSNIMLVLPGGVSQAGVRLGAQTRQRLTEEDAAAIGLEIPEVQVAAPTSRTSAQLVFGNTNWSSTVFGVNNDYLEARDWPMAAGRMFDAGELAGSAKVAWIGSTVARELFGDQDPIEQVVRVRNIPMTVIGVLAPKGQNSMGQDQDDVIVVPISTFRNRVQGEGLAEERYDSDLWQSSLEAGYRFGIGHIDRGQRQGQRQRNKRTQKRHAKFQTDQTTITIGICSRIASVKPMHGAKYRPCRRPACIGCRALAGVL